MPMLQLLNVHTINGESFAGPNFHGVHIILIFPVILSRCKAKALISCT